jgi:hypothetical protein
MNGLINAIGFIASLAVLAWLASRFWPRHRQPRPLSDRSARGEFRARHRWP